MNLESCDTHAQSAHTCVSRKRRREGLVSKGVVEKDVVTVLGEISVPTSLSASEGGSSKDFEESEEEEAAETVESEGGEEEEDEEESSGQEREVDSKNRMSCRAGGVGTEKTCGCREEGEG